MAAEHRSKVDASLMRLAVEDVRSDLEEGSELRGHIDLTQELFAHSERSICWGINRPVMTQRYAHHYPESLRDWIDLLDRLVGQGTELVHPGQVSAGVRRVSD